MDMPDLGQELQKLSVDGVRELGTWVHDAKNFAVDQAPIFAQEYVHWFVWSNSIWAVFYAALLAVLVWITLPGAQRIVDSAEDKNGHHDEGLLCFGWSVRIISGLVALGIATQVFSRLDDVGKGIFAPRVVLVQGVADLLKAAPAVRQ